MNALLDFAGAFLYAIISIILFPLLLLVDVLLLSVALLRRATAVIVHLKKTVRNWGRILRSIDPAVRRRWMSLLPGRH